MEDIPEAKSPEKQGLSNTKSDKSSFTHAGAAIFNQNAMENLLSIMLGLYKTNPSNKSNEEESLTNTLLRNSAFELPKLQRQTSSPGSFGMSNLGFVPTIRKSISIIVRPFVSFFFNIS